MNKWPVLGSGGVVVNVVLWVLPDFKRPGG